MKQIYEAYIDLPSATVFVEAESREEAEEHAYKLGIKRLNELLENKEIIKPCGVEAHEYTGSEPIEELDREADFV